MKTTPLTQEECDFFIIMLSVIYMFVVPHCVFSFQKYSLGRKIVDILVLISVLAPGYMLFQHYETSIIPSIASACYASIVTSQIMSMGRRSKTVFKTQTALILAGLCAGMVGIAMG